MHPAPLQGTTSVETPESQNLHFPQSAESWDGMGRLHLTQSPRIPLTQGLSQLQSHQGCGLWL